MTEIIIVGPSIDDVNDGISTLLSIIRDLGGDTFTLTADDMNDDHDIILVKKEGKFTTDELIIEISDIGSDNERIFDHAETIDEYKEELEKYFDTNKRHLNDDDLQTQSEWCLKENSEKR